MKLREYVLISISCELELFSAVGRYCTGFEKSACEALCRLKKDEDQAKQVDRICL